MSNSFGQIVKQWRDIRRFSQLALSSESGISSRHISFLETGRSKPSRGSVLTLARVLDMPKPATNEALLAAGFAPEYAKWDAGDTDMEPINQAISMILENHMPLPGIVIDAGWNIVGGNAAGQAMIAVLPFKGSLNTVDALLNDDVRQPEKTIRALTGDNMAHAFAINATGPLLVFKHFHCLLPLNEKAVFATLSARVGSIEDNRLGGWISYRASKAALNMGLKTAAIEIGRKYKHAALIALHPGTVQTPLSHPFAGSRTTFTPEEAAHKMLATINNIDENANGAFLDYDGLTIPW